LFEQDSDSSQLDPRMLLLKCLLLMLATWWLQMDETNVQSGL